MKSTMTARRTMPLCPVPSGGGRGERAGAFASGALGAALLAAALGFPAGVAQAQTPTDPRNQCGALSSGEATCSDQAYGIGIQYDAADGWGNGIAGDVALTVTGGSSTTITSPVTARGIWGSGIVVRTAEQGMGDGTTRTIALTVGSGANAVAIRQSTNTLTGGFHNTGVVVHQRGAAADATTVTLGSGVTIGTMATPMKQYGVHVLVENSGNSATHTITSAATIHSVGFGLLMDNRGSGDSAVTNTGSITTAATGGTTGQQSGIRVLDWTGTRGDDRTADTTTTVTNSGSITARAAHAHGIHVDADGLGLYKVSHSGTISVSGGNGHGIHVQASYHAGAAGSEAVEVESSGAITTTGAGGHGILVDSASNSGGEAGDGDIAVTTTGGAIATTGAGAHGIHVGSAGDGDVAVTNAAAIEAGASSSSGIHVGKNPANEGDIAIVNSGAIDARQYGIVVWYGGESDVSIRNSGDIAPASGATPAVVGIHADQAGAGDVTIVNSADVTGSAQGIFARNTEGGGAVTVTHSAGEVSGGTREGILAWIGRWRSEGAADSPAPNSTATVKVEVTGGSVKASETHGSVAIGVLNNEGGSAEVSVSKGATVTAKHNAGIYALLSDRRNTAGRIEITQGGTITAEKGVYAAVARASAAGETRAAAAQPLIDVAWTGTFTQVERERGTLNNVAHAVESAQEAQAGAAIRGAAHTAGIDAEVMSWRVLNRIATTGDDPGEIADKAAQDALLDTGSTDAAAKARAEYILTRFRTVLTTTAATIPGADDIDGDGDRTYSDAELVAYLGADDAARRTLLRDVLARHLSEAEKAVLRAVATGGDVDAALDDAEAGFSEAYKTAVKALVERHNVGDIRVAMTSGTIASSGDGIRAWFAAPHDDNGSIDVTVAEGASVTGAVAGIYAANAGTGLRIAKKYTAPAVQDANDGLGADDLVTLPDYLDQVVRVQGTVTGGTDAAVHLAGGGALIVTGAGKLVAGSSGRAVLVNDPGPAVIYIEGEVTGGEGPEGARAPAAVHLTGGGSVIVGLTGRVRAGGAMSAIRGDGAPPAVIVHSKSTVDELTREEAREDLARIEGGIAGDIEKITIAEVRDDGTTGHVLPDLRVGEDGEVDFSGLPRAELPPTTFSCDMASDGRCRLYEALPSILLAMNDLPSYAERTAAARDGSGGWAQVEMARGEWKADSSTRPDVAYDHRRHGVRAGMDFTAGEAGRVGVSVQVLKGKAEMSGVGEAELDGKGAGLSATWLVGDLYVDVQAGATWYDAKLDGSERLVDEVDGRGHALGLDVGHRMVMGEDLVVTPRAGLGWSKVDLDDFTDEVGSGARVSVRDARSTKGRVGVMVETAVGSEDAPGRVFGSVDVEHEFKDETSVDVSGNLLETTVKPTGVRLGLGGEFSLGEDVVLRVRADYTTRGGDTSEYGGGMELNLRF